jgi:hypothetical protein
MKKPRSERGFFVLGVHFTPLQHLLVAGAAIAAGAPPL